MAKSNKKLGRGLDAIFGADVDTVIKDIENSVPKESQIGIPIDQIRPNPYQPRKVFDQEKIEELAESIRVHGIFTPIIVVKSVYGYDLVAGERRLRASQLVGLSEMPAIVVDFNQQQMMEIALLENIQRENLNVIEEAKAYQQLIEKMGYTQEQLSKQVGKSRSHVTNILRILQLPQKIQDAILEGAISMGHARAMLAVADESMLEPLLKRIISEQLSVREIEKIIREMSSKKNTTKNTQDPFILDQETQLQRIFKTKVKIDNNKVSLNYVDIDDLNRLLELLKK